MANQLYYRGICNGCKAVVAGLLAMPGNDAETREIIKGWCRDGLVIESYSGAIGPTLESCRCSQEELNYEHM